MFFARSNKERGVAASFEDMQQQVSACLQQPHLAQALGELGPHLIQATKQAFLANVRYGVISIPQEKLDSNGFAVVPWQPEPYAFDDTVLAPTSFRAAKMAAELTLCGHKPSHVLSDIIAARAKRSREALSQAFNTRRDVGASCVSILARMNGEVTYTSRPLLLFGAVMPFEPPVIQQGIFVHETVHGIDFEHMAMPPQNACDELNTSAATEARAHAAAGLYLRHGVRTGNLTQDQLAVYSGYKPKVEDALQEAGLRSREVFADDFSARVRSGADTGPYAQLVVRLDELGSIL